MVYLLYCRHPIIKLYIDQIINNIKNKFYGDNFYEPTGPGLFYKIVSSYLNIKKLKKGSNIGKNNDIVRLLVLPKLKEKKSKLLEFELKNLDNENSYIRSGNQKVIKMKFHGYNRIIKAKNKTTHYKNDWILRKIYA